MSPELALAALREIPAGLAAYSLAVVFLGYVVLGVSGFGSALTIVPLLAIRWPLYTVVPLVLLLDVPAALLLARLNASRIRWRELALLAPGLAAGAALGAWLAQWSAQAWALAVLGVYVIAVAVRGLLALAGGAPAGAGADARWAPLAGGAAGIVESLFGTAGPVLVAWLSRRFADGNDLRANLPPALAATTCFALAGMGVSGQLGQPLVWGAWPIALLTALAATAAGHRLAAHLSAQLAARLIFSLLALAGAAMLVRAGLLQWP